MFGQLPNTKEYLKRVKDAGGTVRNDVQIALNDFTKKIYKEGLRDTSGLNHTIKHCNVFPTEGKAGSKYNLWFTDNNFNHDDIGYNYSVETGVEIFDVLTTNFNSVSISLNDGHMGWYVTTPYDDVALIGINTDINDRFMCHPNGYGGFYLDFGNNVTNSGRSLFSIADVNIDSTLGLDIATKLGSQARHILNGAVVKTTTLDTNLSITNGNFAFNSYNSGGVYTDLKIGGFTFGADIPNSKLPVLKEAWDTLQTIINEQRDPSYVNVPAPKLWFDGLDESTLLTNAGSQVSNGGFVRTWVDKSGNGKNIVTDSSSYTLQYTSGLGLKFSSGNGASSLSRADGFYFGTVAFVFTSDERNDATQGAVRGILGHSNGAAGGFDAIVLGGNKTSWSDGEYFVFLGGGASGSGRLALVYDHFNADQRYVVILSRLGTRSGLAKKDNVTVEAQAAVNGHNLTYFDNVAFILGSNNAAATSTETEKFRGFIHEFRNYSEEFTQQQMDALALELTTKWGI